MPLVSKTLEVGADATAILGIVADFETYPQWNDEVKDLHILARYDDGRPSQLRIDTVVQGHESTFIQAVYYPGENQIQTVLQQGDFFTEAEPAVLGGRHGPGQPADGRPRGRDVDGSARGDGQEAGQRRPRAPGRQPQDPRRTARRRFLTRSAPVQAGSAPHPVAFQLFDQPLRAVGELLVDDAQHGVRSRRRSASMSARWLSTVVWPHEMSVT